MKILVTNDDGFGSEGITALCSALRPFHEVWVMAPAFNMSGASCSFTMTKSMRLTRYGQNEYSLEGTPCDCVIAAIKGSLFNSKPDIVLSGINAGYNIGTDVVYSGTCAAARQAALYGVPGVALSVQKKDAKQNPDFCAMADFAVKNIDRFLNVFCGKKNAYGALPFFINVNAPDVKKYDGIVFSSLCTREYNDTLIVTGDGSNTFATIEGQGEICSFGEKDSDYGAMLQSRVAISCIKTEFETCNENLHKWWETDG